MKKISFGYWILAIALFAMALTDFFEYFTVGKELLSFYQGQKAIAELVSKQLIQGYVKMLISLVMLGAGFLSARKKYKEKNID